MGKASHAAPLFDRFCDSYIRNRARFICTAAGLPAHEAEDLEQDLRLHLLRQRTLHDPGKGRWSTFARTVIQRKAAALLQKATAQRRARWCEAASLDEGFSETQHGSDSFDLQGYLALTSPANRGFDADTNLRVDLNRALDRMQPGQRDLAKSLMVERVSEVSKRTGIPRSTLYERIAEIRSHFRENGIHR
ncbi:MAG: sigma factor [Candidatus Polarisedimenticolia bacterium]